MTVLNQSQTITQSTSKLSIIGDQVILGVSGPVGLAQSYRHSIEPLIKNHGLRAPWKSVSDARRKLYDCFWIHAGPAWERAAIVSKTIGPIAHSEVSHQSMIAFPVDDQACLIQFSHQCQPEEATQELPFIAIGSGQTTADPFLSFIKRTFWPKSTPSTEDGKFAVLWALQYCIKARPGGIDDPVQIAVLSKNTSGEWRARELSSDQIGNDRLAIKSIEDEIPDLARQLFKKPPTEPIPEKPKENGG